MGSQLHDHSPASYSDRLRRLAGERRAAVARADRAAGEIAQSLPEALADGLSIVQASQITGISRPTLYRMLSDARRHQDLHGVAARFELALEHLSFESSHSPRPYDLAAHFDISVDEVFESLMPLYEMLAAEVESFGPAAITTLVGILPSLGPPEDPVLKMLLLHRLSPEKVAWSTQLSQTEVFGWASLGLLRVLPQIRAETTSIEDTPTMPDISLPASDDPLGWDDVSMYKLWEESDIPVRRLLEHLYCHPDENESAASIDEYVNAGFDAFRMLVDDLAARCSAQYARALPFARWTDRGVEWFLMPRAVKDLLHVVI